jgi:small conductance mechanosensitive channel
MVDEFRSLHRAVQQDDYKAKIMNLKLLDTIEIDNNYGRVEKITLRTTRIVTIDGKMLAVPSAVIMNKTVTSYTNFPNLRIDISVTIAMSESIDRARAILLSLVCSDENFMDNPPPVVVVTRLNDYNVVLELQAWLKNERMHIQKRFKLREKAFKALTRSRNRNAF